MKTITQNIFAQIAFLIVAVLGLRYALTELFSTKKEVEQLNHNSTLSSQQAKLLADKLYSAMVTILGTNEKTIFEVLEGLSYDDYKAIYNAFGLRQYSVFWGNEGDPLTSENHDLTFWLSNELSVSELRELKEINPLIFD